MKRLLPLRSNQVGFTLIELLVVIIILGILSAVVVFAVRGADDKGRANAIATDRRIIRTAMETYCAQKGTYPLDPPDVPTGSGRPDAMDVLVNEKFLSDRSGYHGLATGPKSAAYPEGKCADLGYKLTGPGSPATTSTIIPPPPAKCFQLENDVEVEVTPAAGQWCLAASPSGLSAGDQGQINHLVQLLDGRVLSIMGFRDGLPAKTVLGTETTRGHDTELFDPAVGDRGAWSPGPVAYTLGDGQVIRQEDPFKSLVLLTSRPGREADDCAPRCGNVLANFTGGFSNDASLADHWKLYQPEIGGPGSWAEIEPRSTVDRRHGSKSVQLLGPGCEPHCGKVLIVPRQPCPLGQVGGRLEPNIVQLYDPTSNEFVTAGEYPLTWGTDDSITKCGLSPQLAELPSGKVLLLIATTTPAARSYAILLDPRAANAEGFFQEIGRSVQSAEVMTAPGFYRHDVYPAVLPDGRSLLLSMQVTEIYRPDEAGGAGNWEGQIHCSATLLCHPLATLPGGDVLVNMNQSYSPAGPYGSSEMRLFDATKPFDSRWTDTGSLNHPHSAGRAVLLSGPACGKHCNKVLIVGSNASRAELYTPPSP